MDGIVSNPEFLDELESARNGRLSGAKASLYTNNDGQDAESVPADFAAAAWDGSQAVILAAGDWSGPFFDDVREAYYLLTEEALWVNQTTSNQTAVGVFVTNADGDEMVLFGPFAHPLTLLPGEGVRVPIRYYAGPCATARPLLLDTFTGPDGQLLTDHVMDVGPGWTLYNADASGSEIRGNRAVALTVTQAYVVSESGSRNVHIKALLTPQNLAAGDVGLFARFQDATHYLRLFLYPGLLILDWVNGGSLGEIGRASFTWAAATTYRLHIWLCNSTVIAWVDGGPVIRGAAPAFNATQTKHGFQLAEAYSACDDFECDSIPPGLAAYLP